MHKSTWQVVENAGYEGERVVSTWETYEDAYCALMENYTPEEQIELHLGITKGGSYEY